MNETHKITHGFIELPIVPNKIVFEVVVNERGYLRFTTDNDWSQLNEIIRESDRYLKAYASMTGEDPNQVALDSLMDEGADQQACAGAALWLMSIMGPWKEFPEMRPDHIQLSLNNKPDGSGVTLSMAASFAAEGGVH